MGEIDQTRIAISLMDKSAKNVLDLLSELTQKELNCRIDASVNIFNILRGNQIEANSEDATLYVVERLIKGLASSRDAARLGFALLLTEILKQLDIVAIEDIFELMKKHLSFSVKQDKRDIVFGQLFAYSAIVRSGKLSDHRNLSQVVLGLFDLWQGKSYILNASYEILMDLFSQLSSEKFEISVWPHIQHKLCTGWEKCSADSLWSLLLSLRMFPEVVTKKYLKMHWGVNDLFSPEKYEDMKKILRQTTACLPMLHPLCSEVLALLETRENIEDIWDSLIDGNMFEADLAEKSYVGFEMVKKVLQGNPRKKTIKSVLSTKFRTIFAKSYLNTKHPMHPAAECLARFLSVFAKETSDPGIQMIILKVFLQPPGSLLSDQIFKRKEVSSIIQNLLPEAVKDYCELLKSIAISKINSEEESGGSLNKRFQAVLQIGALICNHQVIAEIEWRITTIKFLFVHAFFNIHESSTDLLHCDVAVDVPATLKQAFINTFYKAVNSLLQRKDHTAPLEESINILSIIEYIDQLMAATDFVVPNFPLEKIQESWQLMKSILYKLQKQCKKDGKRNESNAFQTLFLELGFHLFHDPEHIPEVLEELHICCKKSLHIRKHAEGGDDTWVCVLVDILISLLSRSSNPLRIIVTSVFPLLCPFITEEALQQILAVINPEKDEDEAMLVDESGDESDIDFESESSGDESDSSEKDNPYVDNQFRKRVKDALGHAAEVSDAESIILSDTEMCKLDDNLAAAFRSRVQTGHTQLTFKDKAMLHFRIRCLDLVMVYLKSNPPMYLVMQCIKPILAAYEYGHKGKHQAPLLHKVVSTLQILTKIKKFQHQDNVEKSELKELLDFLISICHKERNLDVAKKLYAVCVFLVLCLRRLEANKFPSKKSEKLPIYMTTYLSVMEDFVNSRTSNIYPIFFRMVMEACPDLAWNFIICLEEYSFDEGLRIYRRTQCMGILLEALQFSKGQSCILSEKWMEMGNSLFPKAVKALKNVLVATSIKPVHLAELMNIVYTLYHIINEKADQSLLEKHKDLLPLLMKMHKGKMTKKVRKKLIIALGGSAT